MTKNITEVLGRGERLDSLWGGDPLLVSLCRKYFELTSFSFDMWHGLLSYFRFAAVQDMSTRLKEESGKFKVGATQLRELSSLKRFWPIASVTALVIVLLVIRFKFL